MEPVHHFNLAGVDLNLLVVFDALMSEQHVTRAAQKIGLSQPATSNALSRLRNLFKDELFVKTSRGVTATPKAIALAEPIRQALVQIQGAIASLVEFEPATSDRIFRLGMDDYTEAIFLPGLLQQIEQVAPNVKIQVFPTNWQKSPKLLDADEIDVALGHCPEWQSWHQRQLLYEECFVAVVSQNNPLAGNAIARSAAPEAIALADYIAASHLLVSPRGDMAGLVDTTLEKLNLKRRVVMSMPNFLTAALVVANTNLIATLPERIAKICAPILNLHISPLPFEMIGFSVDMLWHIKNNRDLGQVWLRTILMQPCVSCSDR